MARFLRVYGYPPNIISRFDGNHYYPAGGMPHDVYEEWGSIIIRQFLAPKGGEIGGDFFIKLTTDLLNEIEDNVLDINLGLLQKSC